MTLLNKLDLQMKCEKGQRAKKIDKLKKQIAGISWTRDKDDKKPPLFPSYEFVNAGAQVVNDAFGFMKTIHQIFVFRFLSKNLNFFKRENWDALKDQLKQQLDAEKMFYQDMDRKQMVKDSVKLIQKRCKGL